VKERCMIHKIDRHYKRCDSTNIVIYIMWKGKKLPLCHKHWAKIAESDKEWGPQ